MSIPQELIEEIIGHLYDDTETLKCCAVAARSLYPASRQLFFSTISLYRLPHVQKLYQLLESSPDIRPLIRTLHVLPYRNETRLPEVLPKLTRLQHLSIGRKGFGTSWRSIPVSARNALEDMMKSPTLLKLSLTVIFHLPVSVFSIATRVNMLDVYLVVLSLSDTGYIGIEHAANAEARTESIRFIDFIPATSWVCPAMPNLRHCTFGCRTVQNLGPMQKIIDSGANSIQSINWLDFEGGHLDLGVLLCLQHLSIVTRIIDHDRLPRIPLMWTSLTEILGNAPLGNLRELSVTVILSNIPRLLRVIDSTYLGATDAWWRNLDTLLGDPSRVPKLRIVNFMLDITTSDLPSINNRTFSTLIRERLPRLRDAGVLFIKTFK